MDLILIPVLLSDHFWCLCFHLKNGEIELIDNSKFNKSFSKRYRGRPEELIRRKEWIKKLETASIIRKEIDWRTLQNRVDCGVFTMRHMETYKGKSPWNPGKQVYDKAKEFAKAASTVDVLNDLDNKIRDRLDQFFKLDKVTKMLRRRTTLLQTYLTCSFFYFIFIFYIVDYS
ncbi:putative papain-like cysteine peptidase superfamily [Helianthus anomalus]